MASREDSFGGRAGDAVIRAVSPAALITGVLFTLAVALVGFFCVKIGLEKAVPLLAAFLVAAFLAHAAVDAYEAKWRAGRRVSSADSVPVALRYLLLYAVLIVPVVIVGWKPELVASLLVPSPEGGRPIKSFLVLALYAACILVAPPILLVVAVAARDISDLFDPAHWTRCFARRGADLFLIYVLYMGSMLAVLLLCAPVIGMAALVGAKSTAVAGLFSGLFAAGTSILLLGQLCGEFARPLRPAEPATKIIAEQPPIIAIPSVGPVGAPRKGPLLDAAKRVNEIVRASEGDAAKAVAALEELRDSYIANPAVLHALTDAYARASRREDALATAREAIAVCVRSGSSVLAAEIVVAFRETLNAIGVTPEQAVMFAEALRGAKRPATAATLYSSLLTIRPVNSRAVKGALQTAQDLVAGGEAQASLTLYDQLMECSAGTPLEEFVRDGRADAVRKARPA